ncbi:MAG: hypothetical protein WBA12_15760, partial [Catalinimonas sp.]
MKNLSVCQSLLLVVFLLFTSNSALATDYYSQGSGSFSTLSNWNDAADGSGGSPGAADLTSGAHNFFIQSGHTVTVDANPVVNALTLGSGAGTALVFGNDATARSVSVNGALTVGSGARVETSAFDATHTLTLSGGLDNGGTVDLFGNTIRVVNVVTEGNQTIAGNTPRLANLQVNSGTLTAGTELHVLGTVTLEGGTTFADGGLTHTVRNWTESGSGQRTGTGKVVFEGVVCAVEGDNSVVFYDVEFSGGGAAQLNEAIRVENDFLVSNGTVLNTARNHTFLGDFEVEAGSEYNATSGDALFSSTAAQTLTLSGLVDFRELYFDNGGTGAPKTIVGDLKARDRTFVYDDARIVGNGAHRLEEARIDGACDLTGTITFVGGTISDENDDVITLAAAVVIEANTQLAAGDRLELQEALSITQSQFIINAGATVVQTNAGRALTVQNGAALYVRGDDNFPTGFDTYTLGATSTVRYDADDRNQTIRGGLTYGHLWARYGFTKQADGPLDIDGSLHLYDGVTIDLGAFDHTLAGHIHNRSDADLTSTGTLTLDAPDANQFIEDPGSGDYVFNDLHLTLDAPTAARTKSLNNQADASTAYTVNGDFMATCNGSVTRTLSVDINNTTLNGDGGSFSLGENVWLRTNGTTNLLTTANSFGTKDLHVASTVLFDGENLQLLPGITYGNIHLSGSNSKIAAAALNVEGDFRRVGGTPDFQNSGYTINVAGNWALSSTYHTLSGGAVVFDGADQEITTSEFNNVTFTGSGTKTLLGNCTVAGSLTVSQTATVEARARSLALSGNFLLEAGATFSQTTGNLDMVGSNSQVMTMLGAGAVGDLIIDKSGGSVIGTSKLRIGQDLVFQAGRANLSLSGDTLHVGRHFQYNSGCTFQTNGAVLHLNGDVLQNLDLNAAGLAVEDLYLSGTGTKRLLDNGLDVNGDLTIDNTLFEASGNDLNVSGDWNNSGVYQGTNTVTLDGTDQTITGTEFGSLVLTGGGTKTLAGVLDVNGSLTIANATTLDVSPNDYDIFVRSRWDNAGTGQFEARGGRVQFVGNASNLLTGGSGAGKAFHHLRVNQSVTQQVQLTGELRVNGDLQVASGILQVNDNNVYVGGDMLIDGRYFERDGHVLHLVASGGAHTFRPGTEAHRDVVIDAPGAQYTLDGELLITSGRDLLIRDGYFALDGNDVTILGNGAVTVSGGTFDVDAGATLTVGNGATVTNAGGVFRVVGEASNFASLTAGGGTFTFVQTSGTFHAREFQISGTRGNGIDLQGGSLDATDCFSEGAFLLGTGSAYVTLAGLDLGGGVTAQNVSFGDGPTHNVSRTSGVGVITLENTSGLLAGEFYEDDSGDRIEWTFPGGFFWDGGASTSAWNDSQNWSGNTVPNDTAKVYLDHTYVAGAYEVVVDAAVEVDRVQTDAGGGAPITLTLNGANLKVADNLQIADGTTLTQTLSTDTLFVGGDWTNVGTFNPGTATVYFNSTTGGGIITTEFNEPFHNVVVDAPGGTYTLASSLNIDGAVLLRDGTLNLGNSANQIHVAGDWAVIDGTFNSGTGTIWFDAPGGATQTITAGSFNSVQFRNGTGTGTSTKIIEEGLVVAQDVRIEAGATVRGGNNLIRVGGDWRNEAGVSGFQAETSSVVFDGLSRQQIGQGGQPTTFYHAFFQAGGTKEIMHDLNVLQSFNVQAGTVELNSGTTVRGTGTSDRLVMTGGAMRVIGADNFPRDFDVVQLTGGTVDYRADIDQSIFPTTYFRLTLRRTTDGTNTTKTLSGNTVVRESMVIADTDTELNVDGKTIDLSLALDVPTGGRPIVWNGGTLHHLGGGWQIDADLTHFHHLILGGTGTKRVQSDLTFGGDITVLDGVYFDQQAFAAAATGSGQTFTLAGTSRLYSDVLTADGPAMPTGFADYDLNEQSVVVLEGAGDQTIFAGATYGSLLLWTNGIATAAGDLDVQGDFRQLSNATAFRDAGHDLHIAGGTVEFRAVITPSGKVFFDGGDQSISSVTVDQLTFDRVAFVGNGTKTLGDPLLVADSLMIGSDAVVVTSQDVSFTGAYWNNEGTFRQTNNTTRFEGNIAQTIRPGADNEFHAVIFRNGNSFVRKTVAGHGLNVDGGFSINTGSYVDMGAVTHTLASSTVIIDGTWVTTAASFVFDGTSAQSLPPLTARDVATAGSSTKSLQGPWSIRDLTIGAGTTLDVTEDNYPITLTGSWSNAGTFNDREGQVTFESDDTTPKTIDTDGG